MNSMLVRNGLIFLMSLVFVLGISSCDKDDEVDQEVIDQELIKQYIADKNLNATEGEYGLFYVISEPGDDHHPDIYSLVVANYTGYLLNGNVFDDGSVQLESYLIDLVAGFQLGLPKIGEGGKIKLIIPSNLGYGGIEKIGIPEYSVLVFDVHLLQVYD